MSNRCFAWYLIWFLLAGCATGENVAPVSSSADLSSWQELAPYQETLTKNEFVYLLDRVFSSDGGMRKYLEVAENHCVIYAGPKGSSPAAFTLKFAASPDAGRRGPTVFKIREELQALENPPSQPLKGVCLTIDAGHLGGEFAAMEERELRMLPGPPVREGDLNLIVSLHLKALLEKKGAEVFLVRSDSRPVTSSRPDDFMTEARKKVEAWAETPGAQEKLAGLNENERTALIEERVRQTAHKMFYLDDEVRARARLANNRGPSDLTLFVHFNGHGNELVEANPLVLFIHGSYGEDEIATDGERLTLMKKLLSGNAGMEAEAAESISRELAVRCHLEPRDYEPSRYQTRISPNPYIYARNLAANRLYQSPGVYLEPFYMNHHAVYRRLQAGDYEGEREIAGKLYRGIFREYAEAVAVGVERYFSRYTVNRPAGP